MKMLIMAAIGTAFFGTSTAAATLAGWQGWGLSSETPSADIRSGSARTGRTIIGGGLRGGK